MNKLKLTLGVGAAIVAFVTTAGFATRPAEIEASISTDVGESIGRPVSDGVDLDAPTTTASPAGDSTPPPTAPPEDSTFSFAVIPDTQNETYSGDVRMQKRVEWLLAHRGELDLEWVLHSGDVHNWDTADHSQFAAMSEWLRPLQEAGLPTVLAVGNHDTAAVCAGGSACPGGDASVDVRNTTTWNSHYTPARFDFEGVFEQDKSDNGWRTFDAAGRDWLVLSLELWPRTAVIDWAERVVATHPDHNVIVLTHAFLEGSGEVSTSNGGYGANSPATLWNRLDDYPNVVMTFSGHVGAAANTSLTAPDGHRVAAFLQAFHDETYNPTRIVTIDTAAGTVSTKIVANYDRIQRTEVDHEYAAYETTISGMTFVG